MIYLQLLKIIVKNILSTLSIWRYITYNLLCPSVTNARYTDIYIYILVIKALLLKHAVICAYMTDKFIVAKLLYYYKCLCVCQLR